MPKHSVWTGWRTMVGLTVSALLLWWVFRGEDLQAIARRMAAADPVWLLAASALVTSGGLIAALRWRLLLDPLGVTTSLGARWAALNVGFMVTNLFPLRLGELARPFALSRLASISMSSALGTVVLERLFDVVALLLLLLAALLSPRFPADATVVGQPIGYAMTGALVVVITALACVTVLVAWPTVLSRAARPLLRLLPKRWTEHLTAGLVGFLAGFESVRRPAVLAKALLWSLLLWVWWAAAFWTSFRAFGIELGFTAAVFTQCAVSIFIALPAGPGFIGSMEAGVSVSLREVFGVPAESTLSLALGYHLAGFIPVTILGLYYAWDLGLRLRSIESQADAALHSTS